MVRKKDVSDLRIYPSKISDPRVRGRCEHLLVDILVIAVCAVICGAETCEDFEDFAEQKELWLRRFLDLPGGIPSHDTFQRVLSIINPVDLEKAFLSWVQSFLEAAELKAVSIDGKSVKGTGGNFSSATRALHIVSVYSLELGLTLTQSESKGTGGGETEAASECLRQLDLKGVIVMADAGLATH